MLEEEEDEKETWAANVTSVQKRDACRVGVAVAFMQKSCTAEKKKRGGAVSGCKVRSNSPEELKCGEAGGVSHSRLAADCRQISAVAR